MDKIYIIEDSTYVEAHDDFCSDYQGDIPSILDNEFFTSFEDAWEYIVKKVKDRYSEKNIRTKENHSTITNWDCSIDEEKYEISYWNCGEECIYRIKELSKHKKV